MKSTAGSERVRLIVTDMDGTLLNERGQVSEENRAAIQEALAQGILVAVATGRSYKEAFDPLEAVGITCPIICVNGAEIRDQAGNMIKNVPFDPAAYEHVERILRESNLYYELYTNVGTYTDNREKAIQVIVDYIRTAFPDASDEDVREAAERRFTSGEISYVKHYGEVLGQTGVVIYKLLTFSQDEAKLREAAAKLQLIDHLAVCPSASNNLEITNRNAQKGIALRELAEQYNIPLEQTMAMGDNYNDLSMLSIVGVSVAMGNAVDEVKQTCSFVSENHDKHGVSHAIRELVLTAL